MNWRPVVPITCTFCAMLAGFFSLMMTAAGNYYQAAQLIMLSMLLDGLDGTLARMLNATTKFGGELDTYVDMTSFGLAPAFLSHQLVLKDAGIWGLVVTCAIVLSGVSRLSRFRVVDPFRGQRGYLGLPITTCAGWIALFVVITESGFISDDVLSLSRGPTATFIWGCVLAMVFLQVSHVHYGKPTKGLRGMVPGVLLITALFFNSRWAVAAAFTLNIFGFYFAFLSPFFNRRHAMLVAYEEEKEEEPAPLPR
ncbi:MAG: CDP-alcohol phosphatidyltransferase family protein [Kiritimatiellae bacterium]|nr:CDP-alcohol phosphatidyltransferase family protein [Kiritimatiellia bacterium]